MPLRNLLSGNHDDSNMAEDTILLGVTPSPFGLTGEPTDPNGLLYLHARYHAPAIGAFGSRDQIIGANRDG
jgi:hypothetical protein